MGDRGPNLGYEYRFAGLGCSYEGEMQSRLLGLCRYLYGFRPCRANTALLGLGLAAVLNSWAIQCLPLATPSHKAAAGFSCHAWYLDLWPAPQATPIRQCHRETDYPPFPQVRYRQKLPRPFSVALSERRVEWRRFARS